MILELLKDSQSEFFWKICRRRRSASQLVSLLLNVVVVVKTDIPVVCIDSLD